ncbi:MAG: hypothetical protein SGPRY_006230, partial [Prymnesium sp.]
LPLKNVIAHDKWRLDGDVLVSKRKWRVTSDDSVAAPGSDSRDDRIDPQGLSNVGLPAITKLAEAIAIVKATAGEAGVALSGHDAEMVALCWALDLTNAYRELAAAGGCKIPLARWGAARQTRLFGTRHLVDLFPRVSTFTMAVAGRRVREYDACHPHGEARQHWRVHRSAQ